MTLNPLLRLSATTLLLAGAFAPAAQARCVRPAVNDAVVSQTPVGPMGRVFLLDLGAADLDGDGMVDILTANRGSAPDGVGTTLSLIRGEAKGRFSDATQLPVETEGRHSGGQQLILADLDGDLRLDALRLSQHTGTLSVFQGDAKGGFTAVRALTPGADPKAAAVLKGAEGKVRIAVALGSGAVVLMAADATEPPTEPALTLPSAPRQLVAADVDGDGNLDLVAADGPGRSVVVALGQADGGFGAPVSTRLSISEPGYVAVADINGDKVADLVVGDAAKARVQLVLGKGGGAFRRSSIITTGSRGDDVLTAPVVADFNGDGCVDIATVQHWQRTLGIAFGRSPGRFFGRRAYPPVGNSALIAVDMDGDELPDLVAGGLIEGVAVIRAIGARGRAVGGR